VSILKVYSFELQILILVVLSNTMAKKPVIIPKRDFVDIGGMEAEKFIISCPLCKQSMQVPNARPTMVVVCGTRDCSKEFDLVYWRGVTDPEELQQYLDDATNSPSTSFDFETTGLDPYTLDIVGVSFCREDQPGVAIYVPIGHAVGHNMDAAEAKRVCAPFVESHPMNAHNMSFEWRIVFLKWGVETKVNIDSQVEAFLDDSNRCGRFSKSSLKLKDIAREIWELNVTDLKSLVDLKTSNFAYVDIKTAIPYGCQDSDLTTRLLHHMTVQNKANQPLIHRLEHELIPVVSEMSLRGIKLNGRLIADGATKMDKEIERLQEKTFRLMGYDPTPNEMTGIWDPPFDLGSPTRVAEQFFIKMGLPADRIGKPSKMFPKGQPSVGKDALENLRDTYEVMDVYLQYKEAIHMRDSFITTLPTYVNPVTGFIHGSFNATGAPTGRFSHRQPNTAQIPKKRD